MIKHGFIVFLFCYCFQFSAQTSSTDPQFEAQPVGGKEQVEYVLQTQLSLPKTIAGTSFETSLTTYFNLDSTGHATDIKPEGNANKALQEEIRRQFKFITFKRTLNLPNEERPYFWIFKISSEKYHKYYKQKSKYTIKKPLPADSSYIVYTRADRSPEYYKNGDEGLAEFILSELVYPKIAIEKSMQGTVVLEFVVETNGYITNIVPLKSVNGGCTEEAVRILKQTKWQPAVVKGKLVRYKTTYPITFTLRNVTRDGNGSGSSTSVIGQ